MNSNTTFGGSFVAQAQNLWGTAIATFGYITVTYETIIEGLLTIKAATTFIGNIIVNAVCTFLVPPVCELQPTEVYQLANKSYVDTKVTGGTDSLLAGNNQWTGTNDWTNTCSWGPAGIGLSSVLEIEPDNLIRTVVIDSIDTYISASETFTIDVTKLGGKVDLNADVVSASGYFECDIIQGVSNSTDSDLYRDVFTGNVTLADGLTTGVLTMGSTNVLSDTVLNGGQSITLTSSGDITLNSGGNLLISSNIQGISDTNNVNILNNITTGIISFATGLNSGTLSMGSIDGDISMRALLMTIDAPVSIQDGHDISFVDHIDIGSSTASACISIGYNAYCADNNEISIGTEAGVVILSNPDKSRAISLGYQAGYGTADLVDANRSICIGDRAGNDISGTAVQSVAIGTLAGGGVCEGYSVSIGSFAHRILSGQYSVAIGYNAAGSLTATNDERGTAVGFNAAYNGLARYSLCLGALAGYTNVTKSICLNASGVALNSTASGFYVSPVRSAIPSSREVLVLDTATNEIVSTLDILVDTLSGSVSTSNVSLFDDTTTGTISLGTGLTSGLGLILGSTSAALSLDGGSIVCNVLPTCSATPTSASQLTTKTYVDSEITDAISALLAASNTWTNTNFFNTILGSAPGVSVTLYSNITGGSIVLGTGLTAGGSMTLGTTAAPMGINASTLTLTNTINCATNTSVVNLMTNLTTGGSIVIGNVASNMTLNGLAIYVPVLPRYTGVTSPSDNNDLVNKKYVDDAITGVLPVLTVDTLQGSTVSADISLYDTTTTGSITIGSALTLGTITVGSTNALVTIVATGIVFDTPLLRANDPADPMVLFDTTTTGNISLGVGLTTGTLTLGSATSKVIIPSDLVNDSSEGSLVSTNISLYNNTTTGNISLGEGLTTGRITLGPTLAPTLSFSNLDIVSDGTNYIAESMIYGDLWIARNALGGNIFLGNTLCKTTIRGDLTNDQNIQLLAGSAHSDWYFGGTNTFNATAQTTPLITNGLAAGTGDGATYGTNNFQINCWNGLGICNTSTGGLGMGCHIVMDARAGGISLEGALQCNDIVGSSSSASAVLYTGITTGSITMGAFNTSSVKIDGATINIGRGTGTTNGVISLGLTDSTVNVKGTLTAKTVEAESSSSTVTLYDNVTTGDITIGDNLTTGTLFLGNEGAKTRTFGTSIINTIEADTPTQNVSLYDNITTGNITIGDNLTTGSITMGAYNTSSVEIDGAAIDIGRGVGTTNGVINIGKDDSTVEIYGNSVEIGRYSDITIIGGISNDNVNALTNIGGTNVRVAQQPGIWLRDGAWNASNSYPIYGSVLNMQNLFNQLNTSGSVTTAASGTAVGTWSSPNIENIDDFYIVSPGWGLIVYDETNYTTGGSGIVLNFKNTTLRPVLVEPVSKNKAGSIRVYFNDIQV